MSTSPFQQVRPSIPSEDLEGIRPGPPPRFAPISTTDFESRTGPYGSGARLSWRASLFWWAVLSFGGWVLIYSALRLIGVFG